MKKIMNQLTMAFCLLFLTAGHANDLTDQRNQAVNLNFSVYLDKEGFTFAKESELPLDLNIFKNRGQGWKLSDSIGKMTQSTLATRYSHDMSPYHYRSWRFKGTGHDYNLQRSSGSGEVYYLQGRDKNGKVYDIKIERRYDEYEISDSFQSLTAKKYGNQVDVRGDAFVGGWSRNAFNQIVFALVLIEFEPPVRQ
jgi:hypothetical protein